MLGTSLWQMDPLHHRVFTWLRLNAQHSTYLFPTPQPYGIWVLPGQRITSIRQIAEGVQWSHYGRPKIPNTKTISAILDWLQSAELVTVFSNAKGTLICVENWHSYNGKIDEKVTAKETLQGQPNLQRPDTNDNLDNDREKTKSLKLSVETEVSTADTPDTHLNQFWRAWQDRWLEIYEVQWRGDVHNPALFVSGAVREFGIKAVLDNIPRYIYLRVKTPPTPYQFVCKWLPKHIRQLRQEQKR